MPRSPTRAGSRSAPSSASRRFMVIEADREAAGNNHGEQWDESVEAATVHGSETSSKYTDENFQPKEDVSVSSRSVVVTKDTETGEWECKPYKAQLLQAEISKANDEKSGKESHDRIIAKLNELGVCVFVIPHQTTVEMLEDISHVISIVAKDNRCRCHAENQSCLLYQDQHGRLYNLTIEDHAIGITSRWKDVVAGFSGFEAMVALTVLVRAFPCASDDEVDGELDSLRPGTALVLVLGLVFSEETSLSWINTAMFVRGLPSISAYCLSKYLSNDWVRKLMLLSLSIASASTGDLQRGLTLFGVGLACTALLANLGARAWHFLKWKPLQYNGIAAPVVAYLAAMATGALLPYMGHREIEVGGKAAIENVVRIAFLVGIIFLLSDYEKIKENLIVGSANCDQDKVNLVVGSWWTITLLTCLYQIKTIPAAKQYPEPDGELLLQEDQTSPVGFRVPNLPVFPVQPHLSKQGIKFCTVHLEILLGVIVAVALGGFIIYTAFSDIDETLFGQ